MAGFSRPPWQYQTSGIPDIWKPLLSLSELHLRVSRGRQALEALSPHQQGSRDKEGWESGTGAGPHVRSSGSPSRVQNDRKAKSSPAGAPIGVLSKVPPRWGSSCWPCPPWPRALLFQMIQGTCFFLGAGLGLLSTPQVQLAVQPAVSAHRGAPLQQMSALPGPRRSSAALWSGPATPRTEMSSGSRGTQQEHGTHSTTVLPSPQSQPAGPKQPPQERTKGKGTSDIRQRPGTPPPCLSSILADPLTCRLAPGHECTPTHTCTRMYTC